MAAISMAAVEPATPCAASRLQVYTLAGKQLAEVSPRPADFAAVKAELGKLPCCPVPALQKLLSFDTPQIYADDEELPEGLEKVRMVVDETPLYTWDIEGNPGWRMLEGEGSTVSSPNLASDYCNVLTKEPIGAGKHYFRFIMHKIGDEQWCGLVTDPLQAGPRCSGRRLKAWTYYCGRMGSRCDSIVDGKGALHAEGRAVKEFKKLRPTGDVIGMLVDLDRKKPVAVFDLNGELQGACEVPKEPLWVLTHLDTRSDHVELEKPSLSDAPSSVLEAVEGALLDVSQGRHFY